MSSDEVNPSQGPVAAATPPIPAAVEAAATQFQSTFGRRMQESVEGIKWLENGPLQQGAALQMAQSSSQAEAQRELAQHEANLRAVLSEQQHL